MSVVYPKILAIEAQKADGTKWRHRFTNRAAVIGNRDGSLSVRPARGVKLHGLFPYKGKRVPFLDNPPGYPERKTHVSVERLRAPRHRAAALKGWLFRNPWEEKREVVKVDLFKAPAHRRAAVRAYESAQVEKYERSRRRRGERKYVGRRGMPAALAQWHHERFAADLDREQGGGGAVGYARGGRREVYAMNSPRESGAREFAAVVYAQARAAGKSAKAAWRMAGTKYRHFLRQGSLGHSLKYKKNPPLQILFNKPRSNKPMKTRRMPAALKAYWEKRRAAKRSRKSSRTATRRTAAKETVMAKRRRHSRRKGIRTNPPRRAHASRRTRRHHYRRNPPAFLPRMGELTSVLKDGVAVTGGLLVPTLALRVPQLAKFADTKPKRIAAKAILGFAASRLAKRFVGPRYAALMLVGTGAGLVLDLLPEVAPKLGLGLSDGWDPDQFPAGFHEMPGLSGSPYDRPMLETFAEMPGII